MSINLVSVLVATIAGMLLGAFWYSPIAFGKAWMESLGKTETELGSPVIPMVCSILASLATALALAIVLSMTGVTSIADGAVVGAIIGFGIVFTALLSDNLFCGWGAKLLLIQSGYRVLYVIVMASIISAWPGQ